MDNKKRIVLAIVFLFTITSFVFAEECNMIEQLPASCTTGTITQDTTIGVCRTIICTSGADSMQIQACDKDGHYEMYKQNHVGSAVQEMCLGNTCLSERGFERSEYPESCDTPQSDPADNSKQESNDQESNNQNEETNEETNNACYESVTTAPASCTATITQDIVSGVCRTVICEANGNKIKVFACDKPDGAEKTYFEMYRQEATGNTPEVCLGDTCMQTNTFARSTEFTHCSEENPSENTNDNNEPENDNPPNDEPQNEEPQNDNTAPNKYNLPLKKDIVSTIFWVGQHPSADTGWSNNYDSAWDTWWQEHYGGYDDPNNRNGYHPAGFTPKENPFYVAIPYTDFSYVGRKHDAFEVVPWANEKEQWGYQESMIKNRWVKVIKDGKTVYAQVENAGPGPTDDHEYVFGTDPQPNTDFGWKAGIDVSPAVRDYLELGPVDLVDWQWVDAANVPEGPWKQIVTTRQSCWASEIDHCQ